VTPFRRRHLAFLLLVVCAGAGAACGKKGPPLPPMARVPASPANVQAIRVGDEVYVAFDVPAANTSGQTPADMDAVELYAFTGAAPPPGPDPTDHAVRVGTWAVLPSMPVAPEGEPSASVPAPRAFIQGTRAVVREALTAEARVPTPLPVPSGGTPTDEEPAPGPIVAPDVATALKRHYFLVATGPRGRASVPSATAAVSLDETARPPTGLELAHTATDITVKWTLPADARTPPPPADPSLLPSKPLVASPPATTYHVFEVPRTTGAPSDDYQQALPAPLTPNPVASNEASIAGPLVFGAERCFAVRPVDTLAGVVTVGAASAPACITPTDRFPPAPPQRLAAIAGTGVINLIWEPNDEADLAGYVVLRGTAPGDTLQALTPSPIRETTYRDEAVRPGERYVYAVVAVDTAVPQNVSGQSNRVEESPRAPH
jgi:predicted small lipoprotein YifL